MKVHIALVGKKKEPILLGIHQYSAIDKIYLLHSTGKNGTEQIAKAIKTDLETLGIKKIILNGIDPFSMPDIVNTITNIAKEEDTNDLFVNITGGTNLMAGAATTASFFVGAQAYYIKDANKLSDNNESSTTLVELPVPNIPYHTVLEKTQIEILKIIAKKSGKISNRLITNDLNLSPQVVSYHVKELKRKKLINGLEDVNDSRKEYLSLTNAGRLVFLWVK